MPVDLCGHLTFRWTPLKVLILDCLLSVCCLGGNSRFTNAHHHHLVLTAVTNESWSGKLLMQGRTQGGGDTGFLLPNDSPQLT